MTIHGVEKNPKLGYYKVANEIFYSKPEAYIYATQTNNSPTWHFNEIEFAKCKWNIEPESDIRELYRLRAQQLRDRYDWIRLECSGGGDSTTTAFAFLLNGIHLDEVIFRYPKKGETGVTGDASNTRPENTLSEFQFAAQPLLHWIKTNFPDTVVRIHDFSENMLEEEKTRDESWIYQTRHWFQPAHADKYNQFNLKEHRDLADSGKSICVLTGIDKPRLTIINDEWYCYFLDVQANSAHPIVGDYTNITNEYFFWTPDLPEIVVKQCHMIQQWFEMPQNQHLRYLLKWPNTSTAMRTSYEHIAKSIIYPDYDLTTWQTSKPTNSFYNEMDTWFYRNLQDSNLYRAWEAGLKYIVDKVDRKFFDYENKIPVGLKSNLSPFYYIGAASPATQTVIQNNEYTNKSTKTLYVIKDRKLKTIIR